MSRIVIPILVVMLIAAPVPIAAAQTPVDPAAESAALRALVSAVPLGTKVTVQTRSGRRVSGALMQVTDDAMVIKKSTRVPEPAVAVPLTDVAAIERAGPKGGMSVVKAIGIGVGAGAGVILALLAVALSLAD